MGCASAMFTPYTKEETDAELEKLVTLLPLAELMVGGMIKIRGANGFFNPNSLLDQSWLKDKITPEEYRSAIDYINRRTAYTQIGLSKLCSPTEMKLRKQMRTQAGVATVEDLNQRFTSVKFTYQPTAENIEIDMSYSTNPIIQAAGRRQQVIAHAAITNLYIAFN